MTELIGFAQLHNELQNGHLHNFVSCMKCCDSVYIFDQASTDGSHEIYKKNGYKVHYNGKNDFYEELRCKQFLLQWILKEHKEGIILWLDGDEYLDERLHSKEAILDLFSVPAVDFLFFNHYNLWRSDTYYRTDNKFHGLNGNVSPLWRIKPNLAFPEVCGLHKGNMPLGFECGRRVDYSLIHRGFATDDGLIRRFKENFNRYVEHGEDPWITMRSIDETGLSVMKVENVEEILPVALRQNDINPRKLPALVFDKKREIEMITKMTINKVYQNARKWRL